jgi:hypothetical protein
MATKKQSSFSADLNDPLTFSAAIIAFSRKEKISVENCLGAFVYGISAIVSKNTDPKLLNEVIKRVRSTVAGMRGDDGSKSK